MGYAAKVIVLDDVCASQKHQALRQQLHERFAQWRDALERQLPEAELTLPQVSETSWGGRQPLTASVVQYPRVSYTDLDDLICKSEQPLVAQYFVRLTRRTHPEG